MKHTLLFTAIFLVGSTALAQKTTLQLQDASGDRLVIETGTLTANRTTTLPDASGTLMVSGSAGLDDLMDAKSGGANFSNSLLLGHQTTGLLNNATSNTGVGYGTLQSMTSAANNTAMGFESMRNATSANANTAMGLRAMASITSGAENSAFGHRAGENTTTAMMNTAIGEYAMRLNQTASEHTAVGAYALYSMTTGQKNAVLGNGALFSLTSGSQNTVVGADAGSNTLNASGNVFIGYAAGQNETGSNKLYIDNSNTTTPLIYGDFSSNYVTINSTLRLGEPPASGTNYTAFVAQAQASDITYTLPATAPTTGQALIAGATPTTLEWGAGGAKSLDELNDAKAGGAGFAFSVLLGHQNVPSIINADANVAVGIGTIEDITTGDENVAIGTSALASITTGQNNVAIGSYAGNLLQTGSSNVFIGNYAGWTETGSNKLYIDNTATSAPLIYGDFNSNNLTVNGALTLEAGTSTYGGDIDAGNLTNTYIAFGAAGAATDWSYLRQIGTADNYHLVWDFHDNADDARFSIRSIASSGNVPDVITTRLSLDGAGNFLVSGHGTFKSHVTLQPSSSVEGGEVILQKASNTGLWWAIDQYEGDNEARLRMFPTGGGEAYGISIEEDDGHVGIGLANPTARLEVLDYSAVTTRITTGNINPQGMIILNAPFAVSNVVNNQYHYFLRWYTDAGTERGNILVYNGVTYYNNYSDYRLKTDLQSFSAMSLVNKMHVYDYQWKESGMRMHGFMAHELQEVVPYLTVGTKDEVDENGKPIYQMVDYSKLTPILTKAIQEQQAVIESQQQTINDLRSRMERMEQALESLLQEKK